MRTCEVGLTSGSDFWSRDHLRMIVMYTHTNFGANTFIHSEYIDIIGNSIWRPLPYWIFMLSEFGIWFCCCSGLKVLCPQNFVVKFGRWEVDKMSSLISGGTTFCSIGYRPIEQKVVTPESSKTPNLPMHWADRAVNIPERSPLTRACTPNLVRMVGISWSYPQNIYFSYP